MINAVVRPGQTLLDLAIQHAGDASAIYAIAQQNGLLITDNITPGQTIIIPEIVNEKVTNYLQRNQIYPAVGNLVQKEGIGYWAIEDDFIVS